MLQGLWTEEQYLALTDQTNNLIEFTDGRIEGLPMPTRRHQRILILLFDLFRAVVGQEGGEVLVAPLRLRLRSGKYREPDILLLLDASDPRNQDAYWLGADLVVEVVSPDHPERVTEEKPLDYAEAGIPEYWIVNLVDRVVEVYSEPKGGAYTSARTLRSGQTLAPAAFPDFLVEVAALLP
jgi:Uma2 family endonuclease